MSSAITVRQSPTDVFVSQVLPPEKRRDIAKALPAHVPIARFERNLVNAIMQNPDLLQCDPRLVFREVSKIAALGLLMDPQLGEAYLIPGWNARKQCKEPQSRVGYKGLIKLARQSGDISTIYAHEVCEADHIECELGVNKKLVHKPNIFGERGEAIGFYAVVHFKDGGNDFEPMNKDQIDRIRDKSDGWKAFKNGKIKSTPWGTDYDEMAKKTALRRLLKRLPQSPDLASALAHEDAADSNALMMDITPQAPANAVAAALQGPAVDVPADPDMTIDQSAGEEGATTAADAPGEADSTSQPTSPGDTVSPPVVDAPAREWHAQGASNDALLASMLAMLGETQTVADIASIKLTNEALLDKWAKGALGSVYRRHLGTFDAAVKARLDEFAKE